MREKVELRKGEEVKKCIWSRKKELVPKAQLSHIAYTFVYVFQKIGKSRKTVSIYNQINPIIFGAEDTFLLVLTAQL